MIDYSPRETLNVILRRWLLVVVCMLIGGWLGWLAHRLQPPVYEAKAVFTMTVNYNQPDVLSLLDKDHYAEDQIISAAMGLVISNSVRQLVASDAALSDITSQELTVEKVIFIERRQAEVSLVVRNADSQKAARIANVWAQHGFEALKEAYAHANQVYRLNYYIKDLASCIAAQPAVSGLCQQTSLTDLQKELEKAQTDLQAELQASKGLVPAVMFDLAQTAEPPQDPVLYATQGLALAGAIIGFLIGILLSFWRVN